MVLIRVCQMSISNNLLKRSDIVNCRMFDCNCFNENSICEFAVYLEVPVRELRKSIKGYKNRRTEKWANIKRGMKAGDRQMNYRLRVIQKVIDKDIKRKEGEK